jgi:hypothetical protein
MMLGPPGRCYFDPQAWIDVLFQDYAIAGVLVLQTNTREVVRLFGPDVGTYIVSYRGGLFRIPILSTVNTLTVGLQDETIRPLPG